MKHSPAVAIYDGNMTTNIDVQFRYTQHPTEDTMRAVADLYDVYGIRRVRLNQSERTVLVEYDATRLSAPMSFSCCAAPDFPSPNRFLHSRRLLRRPCARWKHIPCSLKFAPKHAS